MTTRVFWAAFFTTLPACWWLAQELPRMFYEGLHDQRLGYIYQVPIGVISRIHQSTGWWIGLSYGMAIQNAVAAVVSAGISASLLRHSEAWRGNWRLRAAVGGAGVLLSFHRPSHYRGGPYAAVAEPLMLACGLALIGAFLLSRIARLQAFLIASALLIVVGYGTWQFSLSDWLESGTFIPSTILLLYSARRSPKSDNVV